MANVANEFPKSGKLGKMQRRCEDLMPEDPMPSVLRQ
jgi:hypothetical protein